MNDMTQKEYIIMQLANGFTVQGSVEPQPDGSVNIWWNNRVVTRHSATDWLRLSARAIPIPKRDTPYKNDNLSHPDTEESEDV